MRAFADNARCAAIACQNGAHGEGRQGKCALKLAASQQLFTYWDALRGVRGAPERNDVEPTALRGVIADTFILEFKKAEGFPFRVVGGRTNALFGRELRGAAFLDLWEATSRDEIARVIESAADGAQPYLVGAKGGPSGAAALDFEVLILPLRHHGATHARVLGSATPAGGAAWFGLLPVRALALTSLRALNMDTETAFGARSANRPSPLRRAHLFVHVSDADGPRGRA
jgi:hypothetical protein